MKKKIDPLFFEEEFHGKEKKNFRKKRKLLQEKDLSKYKKTDLKKKKKTDLKKNHLDKGRVIAVHGQEIQIFCDHKIFSCVLRGILKKEKTRKKTLIAVGDIVFFSKIDLSIYSIEPRISYLSRKNPMTKNEQIIAVNIDQVFITLSVLNPPLKPFLADRFIIAAKRGNMQPILLINKIDLFDDKKISVEKREKEKEKFEEFLYAFEKFGIPILTISCKKNSGFSSLLSLMKNKSSVIAGQSGTGKSSILSKIIKKRLKTADIVQKTKKGKHTTTKAELFLLKTGGFCIDTPGIKSLSMWDLKKEEIQNYFPDLLKLSKKCKYANCLHINEPDCAVKKAVEDKKLPFFRYESYLNLLSDFEEEIRSR